MTLVVADTGPIHYLALIDAMGMLPQLYDRVLIPSAVRDELVHPNSPVAVKKWMATLPKWCEIRKAAVTEGRLGLGPGEAEALALAERVKADLVLLDDRAARAEALRRGLLVTGTIGVLLDAAEHGYVDLQESLDRLLRTSFYIDADLLSEILSRGAERRRHTPEQRDESEP
jgi:predicted nucleic acid-binding protein